MENIEEIKNDINSVKIYKKIEQLQKINLKDIEKTYDKLKKGKQGEWKPLLTTFCDDQYSFINGEEYKTTIFKHDKQEKDNNNKKKALISFDGSGVSTGNILKRISNNNGISFTNSNFLVNKSKNSNCTVYNCLTSKYTVTKNTSDLRLIMKEYITLLAKELENFDEIYIEGHSHGGLKALLFADVLGENETLFKKIEGIFLHSTPPNFKSESLTSKTAKAMYYLFGKCCVSDISAYNLLPDLISKCEEFNSFPAITIYNNINDTVIDGKVSNDFFIDKLRDYPGAKHPKLFNETSFDSDNHICRKSKTIFLELQEMNLTNNPSSVIKFSLNNNFSNNSLNLNNDYLNIRNNSSSLSINNNSLPVYQLSQDKDNFLDGPKCERKKGKEGR